MGRREVEREDLRFCAHCGEAQAVLVVEHQIAYVLCRECFATGPVQGEGEAAVDGWNEWHALPADFSPEYRRVFDERKVGPGMSTQERAVALVENLNAPVAHVIGGANAQAPDLVLPWLRDLFAYWLGEIEEALEELRKEECDGGD